MALIELQQAVYGPRANGSAVQLLAQSGGLGHDALTEFSRFYYAAWELSGEETKEFLTFLPLYDDTWGLIRSQVIDKRSMGDLFVSRLLTLTLRDLEAIEWRSNRIWHELLGTELVAPPPKTGLETIKLDVSDNTIDDLATDYAENLAFAAETRLRKGQSVQIPAFKEIGTPLEGLILTLERLGGMAAGISYCSSMVMVSSGYRPRTGAFGILASGMRPNDPARPVIGIGERPSEIWIERRLRVAGIEPIGQVKLDIPTVKQLARDYLSEHREQILQRHDFRLIGNLARTSAKGRGKFVAPYLLALVLEELQVPSAGAAALDHFVAEDLDHCLSDRRLQEPHDVVASAAARTASLFWAKKETIRALGAHVLFGEGGRMNTGHLKAIDAGLDAVLDPAILHPDAAPDHAAIAALMEFVPATTQFEAMRLKLLAISAALPDSSKTMASEYLMQAGTVADFEQRQDGLADLLPPELADQLRANFVRTRDQRLNKSLSAPVSIEDGVLGLVLAIREIGAVGLVGSSSEAML